MACVLAYTWGALQDGIFQLRVDEDLLMERAIPSLCMEEAMSSVVPTDAPTALQGPQISSLELRWSDQFTNANPATVTHVYGYLKQLQLDQTMEDDAAEKPAHLRSTLCVLRVTDIPIRDLPPLAMAMMGVTLDRTLEPLADHGCPPALRVEIPEVNGQYLVLLHCLFQQMRSSRGITLSILQTMGDLLRSQAA